MASRVTVGLMIAITGCIGAPEALFAADNQVQIQYMSTDTTP